MKCKWSKNVAHLKGENVERDLKFCLRCWNESWIGLKKHDHIENGKFQFNDIAACVCTRKTTQFQHTSITTLRMILWIHLWLVMHQSWRLSLIRDSNAAHIQINCIKCICTHYAMRQWTSTEDLKMFSAKIIMNHCTNKSICLKSYLELCNIFHCNPFIRLLLQWITVPNQTQTTFEFRAVEIFLWFCV